MQIKLRTREGVRWPNGDQDTRQRDVVLYIRENGVVKLFLRRFHLDNAIEKLRALENGMIDRVSNLARNTQKQDRWKEKDIIP